MAEQKASVEFKGVTYLVTLDEDGFAWYIDPFNNPLTTKTSLGQREGEGNIHNIEDAKKAVLIMLKSSGR